MGELERRSAEIRARGGKGYNPGGVSMSGRGAGPSALGPSIQAHRPVEATGGFGDELESGFKNYLAGFGHIGGLLGSESAREWAIQKEKEAAEASARSPYAKSLDDIEGIGDIPSYLGHLAAQSLPYSAEVMLAALSGGTSVGAKLGLQAGGKALAKNVARTGLGRAALKRGTAKALAGTPSRKIAATQAYHGLEKSSARALAGAIGSYPSAVGQIASSQNEQAGEYDAVSALAGGVPFAGLNLLGIESVALRGLPRGAAKSRAARALTVAGATAGAEGSAEVGQTFLEEVGRKSVDPTHELGGAEAARRYLESFAGGAALGGVFGGVSGTFTQPQIDADGAIDRARRADRDARASVAEYERRQQGNVVQGDLFGGDQVIPQASLPGVEPAPAFDGEFGPQPAADPRQMDASTLMREPTARAASQFTPASLAKQLKEMASENEGVTNIPEGEVHKAAQQLHSLMTDPNNDTAVQWLQRQEEIAMRDDTELEAVSAPQMSEIVREARTQWQTGFADGATLSEHINSVDEALGSTPKEVKSKVKTALQKAAKEQDQTAADEIIARMEADIDALADAERARLAPAQTLALQSLNVYRQYADTMDSAGAVELANEMADAVEHGRRRAAEAEQAQARVDAARQAELAKAMQEGAEGRAKTQSSPVTVGEPAPQPAKDAAVPIDPADIDAEQRVALDKDSDTRLNSLYLGEGVEDAVEAARVDEVEHQNYIRDAADTGTSEMEAQIPEAGARSGFAVTKRIQNAHNSFARSLAKQDLAPEEKGYKSERYAKTALNTLSNKLDAVIKETYPLATDEDIDALRDRLLNPSWYPKFNERGQRYVPGDDATPAVTPEPEQEAVTKIADKATNAKDAAAIRRGAIQGGATYEGAKIVPQYKLDVRGQSFVVQLAGPPGRLRFHVVEGPDYGPLSTKLGTSIKILEQRIDRGMDPLVREQTGAREEFVETGEELGDIVAARVTEMAGTPAAATAEPEETETQKAYKAEKAKPKAVTLRNINRAITDEGGTEKLVRDKGKLRFEGGTADQWGDNAEITDVRKLSDMSVDDWVDEWMTRYDEHIANATRDEGVDQSFEEEGNADLTALDTNEGLTGIDEELDLEPDEMPDIPEFMDRRADIDEEADLDTDAGFLSDVGETQLKVLDSTPVLQRPLNRRSFLKGAVAFASAAATFNVSEAIAQRAASTDAHAGKPVAAGLREALETGDVHEALTLIANEGGPLGDLAYFLSQSGFGNSVSVVHDVYSTNIAGRAKFNEAGDGVILEFYNQTGPSGLTGVDNDTVVHEALHALILSRYKAIGSYTAYNRHKLESPDQVADPYIDDFIDLWRTYSSRTRRLMADNPDTEYPIGVLEAARNPDELFVRALTDPDVRAFLQDKSEITGIGNTFDTASVSLWEKFMRWLSDLLGMGREDVAARTALDQVLDQSNYILDATLHDSPNYDYARSVRSYLGDNAANDEAQHSKLQDDVATPISTVVDEFGGRDVSEDLKLSSPSLWAQVWKEGKFKPTAAQVKMEKATNVSGWAKDKMRKTMQLHQLREVYAGPEAEGKIPALEPYYQTAMRLGAAAEAYVHEKGSVLAEHWTNIDAVQQGAVENLLYQSTWMQVDPRFDENTDGHNENLTDEEGRALAEARARYKAMSQAERDTVDATLGYYEEQLAETRQFFFESIDKAGLEEDERAAARDEANRMFSEIKVYFPLNRDGEHLVVGRSPELVTAEAEATKAKETLDTLKRRRKAEVKSLGEDANQDTALARELKAYGRTFAEANERVDALKHAGHYVVTATNSLASQNATVNEFERAGLNTTAFKKDEFYQGIDSVSHNFMQQLESQSSDMEGGAEFMQLAKRLYLLASPSYSMARRGLKRERVPGYTRNADRAVAKSVQQHGFMIGKLQFAQEAQEHLTEMVRFTRAIPGSDPRRADLQNVTDIVRGMHAANLDMSETPVQDKMNNVAHIWFLGNTPSFFLMNMMQPYTVSVPMMGAKYGNMRALRKMGRHHKTISGLQWDAVVDGIREKGMQGFFDEMHRANMVKPDSGMDHMLREMMDRGHIELNQVLELAGTVEDKGKWGAMMKASTLVPKWTEKINRIATAMAAYELFMENENTSEMTEQEIADKSNDYVEHILNSSHFNYSGTNAAYMWKALPGSKVILQFRKYQQHMAYALVRSAHQSFKGATAQERAEARRTLTGLAVTHGIMAGSLGLPGVELASMMINEIADTFGDDDDPYDANNEWRKFLADVFGEDVGLALAKGLPAAALGTDLSSRVGLQDIFSPARVRLSGAEGRQAFEKYLVALLGPSATVAGDLYDGMTTWSEDPVRGVEKMLPKLLRDMVKAGRFASEGVTTGRGMVMIPPDDLSTGDLLAQALGLTPTELTEFYEARGVAMNIQDQLKDRRGKLLRDYVDARKEGDTQAVAEARAAIRKYNAARVKDKKPRIKGRDMTSAVKRERDYLKSSVKGIHFGKREKLGYEEDLSPYQTP